MFNVNFTGVNFARTAVFQNRVAFCQKRCYTMLTWLSCLHFFGEKNMCRRKPWQPENYIRLHFYRRGMQ